MTNLNARFSGNGSRVNSSLLPPPGTPRGVHGMSAEDLRGDLEKGELDDLKTPGSPRDEQGRRIRTKVTRTWYGRKKTVVVPVEDEAALEGIPEKRAAMMLAPITNGLAFGLSICELSSEPLISLFLTFLKSSLGTVSTPS